MTTLAQIVLSSSREELQMPVHVIVNGVRKPFRNLVMELREDWPDMPILCVIPKAYTGNTLPLVDLDCTVLFEDADASQLRECLRALTSRRGPKLKKKSYQVAPAQSGQIARVM